ncbi:hypothetical protein GCM10027051_36320 [Niabella terrae]
MVLFHEVLYPYVVKKHFTTDNKNRQLNNEYGIRVEWVKVVERPDAFWKKNLDCMRLVGRNVH